MHTVGRSIGNGLALRGFSRAHTEARVLEALKLVELPTHLAARYPHQLSGGQQQRVSIAAAIALEPEVIVADEPVSSLDVSAQAQIIDLLIGLKGSLGLSMLFISHDLGVVSRIADRVMVLYHGRLVEHGRTADVLARPLHPYTQLLISAIPGPGFLKRWREAGSQPPKVLPQVQAEGQGCVFAHRCPVVLPACVAGAAPEFLVAKERGVACLNAEVTGIDSEPIEQGAVGHR
jgi:oligopeptide/dipeptide ABC transporter ATP-binding protein